MKTQYIDGHVILTLNHDEYTELYKAIHNAKCNSAMCVELAKRAYGESSILISPYEEDEKQARKVHEQLHNSLTQ